MSEQERYEQAKRRVEELKGFYGHLGAYAIVNTALFIINIVTGSALWFFWPMLGWGIGLAAHAFAVFVAGDTLGTEWEHRKIAELMRRGER